MLLQGHFLIQSWLFYFLLTNFIGSILLPEEVVTSLIMELIIAFNI